MSWSIAFIGKSNKVIEALNSHTEKLSGPSKTEYESALPHLVGLIKQNFNKDEQLSPMVKINASGHGLFSDGEQMNGTCTVNIETVYGVLV